MNYGIPAIVYHNISCKVLNSTPYKISGLNKAQHLFSYINYFEVPKSTKEVVRLG